MMCSEADCPNELRSYIDEVDLCNNIITSSAGEIQNGHLLALYFSMNKQKSIVFQKFYEILKRGVDDPNKKITGNYSKVYSKCYNVVNKYNSLVKKGKRFSIICNGFVQSVFPILIEPVEEECKVICSEEESNKAVSSSSDILMKIERINGNCENVDSSENFNGSSININSNSIEINDEKVNSIWKDAANKLHDAEIQIRTLTSSITELREELDLKNRKVQELEGKLRLHSSQEEIVAKLKEKNKQLREMLREKLSVMKTTREKSNTGNKKSRCSKVQSKKEFVEENSKKVKESIRKDLENRIVKLLKEQNTSKVSEQLLESFPDISISDFEVILKILTDSNALLEQKIIHKWNVDGQDVTYYGVIKENLVRQKKFYINYWEDPNSDQPSNDCEIVEYNSIIADIIMKDLTFSDPCSLF